MGAPVWKMKKTDIVWLARHKCKHSTSYLEHYSCFLKEGGFKQKQGYIDIETTNLSADFGIILCYYILDRDSDKTYTRTITKADLNKDLDKNVVESCIKDMQRFDRLWGFYSSRFDCPFIRTRAVALGLEFPEFGELLHNDLYYLVRNKFRLSRNRLDNACRALLGSTDKTRIDADYWIRALQGHKPSLDYISEHCRLDVKELKRLHAKIEGFGRVNDTSI